MKASRAGGALPLLSVTPSPQDSFSPAAHPNPRTVSRIRARPRAAEKGATVTHSVDACAAHHWYDVTVTSFASTDYVRRLAVHVETGAASQSDRRS